MKRINEINYSYILMALDPNLSQPLCVSTNPWMETMGRSSRILMAAISGEGLGVHTVGTDWYIIRCKDEGSLSSTQSVTWRVNKFSYKIQTKK